LEHTCAKRFIGSEFISRLNLKQDTTGLSVVELKALAGQIDEDVNFYRKVSKYDMDRYQVDWKELHLERERQITENTKRNKNNVEKKRGVGKQLELINKISKIQDVSKMRTKALEQSKMTAKKNQEQLASLIKQTKENDKATSKMASPFQL